MFGVATRIGLAEVVEMLGRSIGRVQRQGLPFMPAGYRHFETRALGSDKSLVHKFRSAWADSMPLARALHNATPTLDH